MKVINQLFNFYINASIHVALAVYALTYLTLIQFNISYDETVLCFVFFATITGYNFVKYFGLAKFHHRSLATWLRAIQIFSFFSFVLMFYFAMHLPRNILIYLGVFALMTFFYAIPFLPKHFFVDRNQNLRSISGLKVYVIALVWCGITVFLPLLKHNYFINDDVLILGIQRFCFVVLLMLPFEIRDLKFDSLKLATIPQKIGVRSTKLMGFFLAMTLFFLEFFKDELIPKNYFVLAIILMLVVLLIAFSKKNQNKYYSSFWVEGIPILWLILALIIG